MTETRSQFARLVVSVVLIVVILAAGAGVGYWLDSLRREPPRKEDAALAPFVDSVVVVARDVVERLVGYGSVLPDRAATLSAEVPAQVVELVGGIEAGSTVEEDQALIRLDDRPYRRELERAEALADADQAQLDEITVEQASLEDLIRIAETELRIATDEKARVSRLFEEQNAERREYDLVNLAYQQARRVLKNYRKEREVLGPRRRRVEASRRANEAGIATARLNVERCTIKAPFAGTIDRLLVEAGDLAAGGTPLLTLIDPAHVEIPIQLPASARGRVRVGAPCRIESEGARDESWQGEVARIAPLAQQQTRTFAVYLDVDNTRQVRPLLPGTFVRAVVDGPTHLGGLVIPRGAIRRGHVFIVEDDVARRRAIEIERFLHDGALVRGQLTTGDRVILSHLDQLADGSLVRVRPVPSHAKTVSLMPADGVREASP
jgi:RND family efflux transporter MFP subunit